MPRGKEGEMMKDFWLFIVAAITGVLLACAGLVPAANAQGNAAPDAVDDTYSIDRENPYGISSPIELIDLSGPRPPSGARLASLSDGRYILVWQDAPFGAGAEIYARFFSNDFIPDGDPVRVSPDNFAENTSPRVVAISGAGFVVSWNADGALVMRRYDSTLGALGVIDTIVDSGIWGGWN